MDFKLELRGNVWIVAWNSNGCRPATEVEVALWKKLHRDKAKNVYVEDSEYRKAW